MRVPLVHGQGNFGSVDGDPPAADRYTEAKLTAVAELLMAELRQQHRGHAAQLRQHPRGAGRPAGAVPEPAGQRRLRHRRRHGHEHPAAQPRRGRRGLRLPDRQPGGDDGPAARPDQGAGLPARRQGRHRPRHAAQDLRGGHAAASRCRASGRSRTAARSQQIVVTSIPYGVDKGKLETDIGEIIAVAQAAAAAQPGQRVQREGRPAHRPGDQAGHRPEPGDGLPLQAHGAAGELLLQHDVPGAGRRRGGQGTDPARAPRPQGRSCATSSISAWRRCAAASSTSWSNCGGASTSSKASASSSTPWTGPSR